MGTGFIGRTALLCAASWVLPAGALAGAEPGRLGRLTVDGHEATVTLEEPAERDDPYRVWVEISKPRKAPGVDAGRLGAWLLTQGGGSLRVAQDPQVGLMPEEGEGEEVKARAVFFFGTDDRGREPVAAVVAVDGEPKAFKVPHDTGGVGAVVIAAWKKAGADFQGSWRRRGGEEAQMLPTFFVTPAMKLPPREELPLPRFPFGLSCYALPAKRIGPNFLAGVPGRDRAQALSLHHALLSPADWKELAGLKQLRELHVTSCTFDEAGVKALAGLKDLRRLSLSNSDVADAGLKELAGLGQLEDLDLSRLKITDRGLKELAGLGRLRKLDLSSTDVSDAGVRELAPLKDLRALDLSSTQVTGSGLAALAGLGQLRELNLSSRKFNDDGLKALAGLKGLRTLDLRDTQITGAGLGELAGLRQLHTLNLGSCGKLTDAGCRELAGLKQLRELYLYSTPVGDAGLKGLAGLTELRVLHLGHTKVTGAGLAELAGLRRLRKLDLPEVKVGDAGMKHLAALGELRALNLYATGISSAGLKELAGLRHLRKLDVAGHGWDDVAAGVAELRKALPLLYVIPSRSGGPD